MKYYFINNNAIQSVETQEQLVGLLTKPTLGLWLTPSQETLYYAFEKAGNEIRRYPIRRIPGLESVVNYYCLFLPQQGEFSPTPIHSESTPSVDFCFFSDEQIAEIRKQNTIPSPSPEEEEQNITTHSSSHMASKEHQAIFTALITILYLLPADRTNERIKSILDNLLPSVLERDFGALISDMIHSIEHNTPTQQTKFIDIYDNLNVLLPIEQWSELKPQLVQLKKIIYEKYEVINLIMQELLENLYKQNEKIEYYLHEGLERQNAKLLAKSDVRLHVSDIQKLIAIEKKMRTTIVNIIARLSGNESEFVLTTLIAKLIDHQNQDDFIAAASILSNASSLNVTTIEGMINHINPVRYAIEISCRFPELQSYSGDRDYIYRREIALIFLDTFLRSSFPCLEKLSLFRFYEQPGYIIEKYSEAILMLYRAQILTLEHAHILISEHENPIGRAHGLIELQKKSILTKENIEVIQKHPDPKNLTEVTDTLQKLSHLGILNERARYWITVSTKTYEIGSVFSILHEAGLLSDENINDICSQQNIALYDIARAFKELSDSNQLTAENRQFVLKHRDPSTLTRIIHKLAEASINLNIHPSFLEYARDTRRRSATENKGDALFSFSIWLVLLKQNNLLTTDNMDSLFNKLDRISESHIQVRLTIILESLSKAKKLTQDVFLSVISVRGRDLYDVSVAIKNLENTGVFLKRHFVRVLQSPTPEKTGNEIITLHKQSVVHGSLFSPLEKKNKTRSHSARRISAEKDGRKVIRSNSQSTLSCH